ncbi:MAG: hypothetical protein M1837_000542 [Sclerophora amabilis]|nr:MAG: hypothetical protein M1837_000542 [Sclerophora amabilis]
MNTSAYLTRQGWLGAGYSLHGSKGDSRGVGARGLSKPILVSQKLNRLGVGKKKHDLSDQWWMRAFDRSLTELDVDGVRASAVQKQEEEGKDGDNAANPTRDSRERGPVVPGGIGARDGGLYGRFVRGKGLVGTIGEKGENLQPKELHKMGTKKRKRDNELALQGVAAVGQGSKLEEKKSKEESSGKKSKARRSHSDNRAEAGGDLSKEERRARRREKRAAKESIYLKMPEKDKSSPMESKGEKRRNQTLDECSGDIKEVRKPEVSTGVILHGEEDTNLSRLSVDDTIEERRRRKEAKRARKAQKLNVLAANPGGSMGGSIPEEMPHSKDTGKKKKKKERRHES